MTTEHHTEERPIRQVRNAFTALLDEGQTDEAVELVFSALRASVDRIAELELLLKKLRGSIAGKSKSERIDPHQLSLLLSLLGDDADQEPNVEDEERADEELNKEIEDAKKKAAKDARDKGGEEKKRRRRKALQTEGLERRHTHLPVPKEQQDWEVIGEKLTNRLRYSPSQFYVEVIHQPVTKSPELSESGSEVIATVPAPPTIVPNGMAGNDVIANLVIRKCDEHTPMTRLHRIILQEQGVDLPVSTLCDWFACAGESLSRLHQLMFEHVLSSFLVQTDGTGLRVLDSGPEGVHRGTIHGHVGHCGDPDAPPYVVFVYTPSGKAEDGPWRLLAGRTGYIQADASNAFDRLFNGKVASAVEVGCHFHARRKLKANDLDPRVAYPLQLIRRLYRLETLADTNQLTWEQRSLFRQERSAPILEKLRRYLAKLLLDGTKTDPVCQGAQYYMNHWEALTRFVQDGRLPLDNNRMEVEFRYIRLGEHNYLFAGSDGAAEHLAVIYSVLATARAHGLNLHEYLCDVLDRLSYPMTKEAIAELLPHRWKMLHPAEGG